jgi:glycosyltransferase involved in cell wall biosynthesis
MVKRILYISNLKNPFIEIDYNILKARYDVRWLLIERRHPRLMLDMLQATRNIDLVVAWFASWHSLPAFIAAQLRHIPCLLIAGGYDVASEPEINYGLRRGGLSKLISGQVFRLASRTLIFSNYAYQEALRNTPLKPEKTTEFYLGVPDEPEFMHPVPKEPIAFTVGTIDAVTAWRKGIQPFVEAARYLPAVPFMVIGKPRDKYIEHLKEIATPNVQFTGFMSTADLIALRRRAKVYVQVSRHEGFGLAVAEAMLGRCIPVVSRYGALPEVVGNTGVCPADLQPETVADAIQSALISPDSQGEAGRQHILTHFPLEQRAQKLCQWVDELT